MAWLIEDATLALIVVGAIAIGFVVAFFRTGRGLYFYWFAAIALVGLALWLVERWVVTDRERVETTIYGAVEALRANDVEGVLAAISPTAEPLRSEVRGRMRSLEVRDAVIGDVKIDFSRLELPPKAIATFLGRLDFKSSQVPLENYIGRMTVNLRQEGDAWLIESYRLEQR
jgi:hypothetical protein